MIFKMSLRRGAMIHDSKCHSQYTDSWLSNCHSEGTLWFTTQNVTPSTLWFMIVKMSLPVDAMIHDCQNVTPRGRYDSWLSKCHSQWTLCFMIVKMSLPVDAMFRDCQNVTSSGRYDIWLSKRHSHWALRFMTQNVTPRTLRDSWLSNCHSQRTLWFMTVKMSPQWTLGFMIFKMSLTVDAMIPDCQNPFWRCVLWKNLTLRNLFFVVPIKHQ